MLCFQTIYIHVACIFSSFSLVRPFKNVCQLALKRMKMKFLLPFTMNTKAVLDASQPSSRNQYVRSEDINSCCGIRRHWSRRPNRQPNGNSATVYSSLTLKSSPTPWIPCFEDISIHQMHTLLYFPKHLVYLQLKLTFSSLRRTVTDLSLHISDWTPSWFPQGPCVQL